MPAHQFRWDTLISEQYNGELIPVFVTDRMQTVTLGLLYDLMSYRQTFFEDYEGNESAITEFINDCIQRMLVRMSSIPVGTVIAKASASLPDGWLYCNGDEVLKATYPDLWNEIGTLWGTATLGSDYFVLPDFRDKFLLGYMQGGGSPVFAATGGEKTHTLTTNEIPDHSHKMLAITPGSSSDHIAFTAIFGSDTPNGNYGTFGAGGGAAHNNMPPYRAVSYIIFAGAVVS